MHRFALILIILLMGTTATLAQEDAPVCPSPFVTTLPNNAVSVMRVDQVQINDTQFANRMRFEHAYNAIKFEIRVNQLNQLADANESDAAQLIASDGQIQQINLENEDRAQLGNRVLGDLAADAIIWAYVADNDLTITQEHLTNTIDTFLGITEETDEERQALIDTFTQRILANGTAPEQLTTFFCRQALYDSVQNDVIVIGDTTLYVNADHILVSSQDIANDLVTLLANGDDFAALATDLSLDVASAERGGALGWQPALFYVPSFADAVSDAPLNTVLNPVQTQFGWHVIRVNEREERPITEELRPLIASTLFSRWRGDQINVTDLAVNPDWQAFIPEL